jgi:hypothetical protein
MKIKFRGMSWGLPLQASFVKRLLKTGVGKMNEQGMRANPVALSE